MGDDENYTIPNKRHPHLNKILVFTEVARTFLREMLLPFVHRMEFRSTHAHTVKGAGF